MMNHVQNWAQQFNISEDKIVELQSNLKTHETVLQKCFENNLINEANYLLWAKKHYNTPTLKASFFDQPKPEALIQKYLSQLPPFTLPVIEQDGILYVACLEPVKNFKFAQPIQWLLAPYSVMLKWLPHEIQHEDLSLPLEIENFSDIKKLAPQSTQEPLSATTQIAPPPHPPIQITNEQPDSTLSVPKQNITEATVIELPPPKSAPPLEEPIKLDSPTPSAKSEPVKGAEIDFSKMVLDEAHEKEPEVKPTDNPFQINIDDLQIEDISEVSTISPMDNTEAPPGVEPYQAIELSEDKLKIDLTVVDMAPLTPTTPVKPSPSAAPKPVPPAKPSPSATPKPVPPVKPPPSATPKPVPPVKPPPSATLSVSAHVIDSPISTEGNSEINFSGVAPIKPTIPNSMPTPSKFWDTTPIPQTGAPNLEAKLLKTETTASPPPPPIDEISEIDHGEIAQQALNKDAPDIAFSQMKSFFDQCMILLFENQKLKPWKHDSTWQKDSATSDIIDLSTPSIFRIVAETRKSYHGHVIPNTINDSFFNSWNKGNYPEHITMCPLLLKSTLVGILLGGTSKERARSVKLETIERIANQLAQDLQIPKKVA